MDPQPRKQSIKSKLSISHLSHPSALPLSNHKTSIFSPSPRPPQIVSQKRQYDRMKLLFRNSVNDYYSTEVKNILQDQVRKIKQAEKVKNMIETLKTCESKEIMREKHHQKVAMVSEQVKSKDLQKSISALEGYLKKQEQTESRVRKFIKQKKEQYLNRSLLSQRSHGKQQELEQSSSSINCVDASLTERKKSLGGDKSSEAKNQERREKLRVMREEQEGMKITSFLSRMKGMERILAQKQISKHQKIHEMKKIPVKCLTRKRNDLNEGIRQSWQKQLDAKKVKAESYLESKERENDMNNFEKSVRSLEHSRVVGDRRQELNRNLMELKASKSQINFSSLIQRRYLHETILQQKKEFKIKKEFEKENNNRLMRKLEDKISNLKLISSKDKLPDEEIHNFQRLLKELGNKTVNPDVFRETKYSVAHRIVAQEESRIKSKKLNKKNH